MSVNINRLLINPDLFREKNKAGHFRVTQMMQDLINDEHSFMFGSDYSEKKVVKNLTLFLR